MPKESAKSKLMYMNCDGRCIVKGLIAGVIAFIVSLVLIGLMWNWIVPDIFPGLVLSGYLAGAISWYTAFKLAIVAGLIIGIKKGKKMHHHMCMMEKY